MGVPVISGIDVDIVFEKAHQALVAAYCLKSQRRILKYGVTAPWAPSRVDICALQIFVIVTAGYM